MINFEQSKVEKKVKFLYDLNMLLFLKFCFFRLLTKYLFTIWVVFFPVIASALGVDEKAIQGVELYKQQKYNQAGKKFLEAYQEKPDDPKISYNLGNSHYKQGSYGKALQNYSRSAEQKFNPSMNQKSYYNMGNALFRMNKLEESIAAYKKALELDPSDMDSKFNLEFVREQIKKKKQNKNKSTKNKEGPKPASQKGKNADNEGKQPNQNRKENTTLNKEPSNHKNNPKIRKETASGKMTKEEAEQRLSVLTEDLKHFQRKQALEMKSLFTYQGNDW